jgi:hypothetical protein
LIQLTGIRLTDVRVFNGEHVVPIAPGLTVIMGRNNSGKSTILRAPFLFVGGNRETPPVASYRRRNGSPFDVGLQFRIPPEEFPEIAGFEPRRLHDVQVTLKGNRSAKLDELGPFTSWDVNPALEVGWRNPGGGTGAMRVSRMLGSDRQSVLEISNADASRCRIDNEWVQTTAPREWFAGSFATLGNAALPFRTLAHWEHHRVEAVSSWIDQPTRRVVDTDEKRLQETLTFLRMKCSPEFERISEALRRALPEFTGLDFIDAEGSGFNYRPGFVTSHVGGEPLARENIGSGAWTYLCVLTAARAAKATGARVLFLDEPHLYMHPGLERALLDELLDPDKWDGEPLQIVAATHSPSFVNAAVEGGVLNVLDWQNEARTEVVVRRISANAGDASIFTALTSEPGDLLYADRLVFVEGPSDVVALRLLAKERCHVRSSLRFVPLRETDAIGPDVARYFAVVVRAHGTGFQVRGLVILDGDKQARLEAAWDKLDADRDPRKVEGLAVVWSDKRGNDIESLFCEEAFLVSYFERRGVPSATSEPVVRAALAGLKFPADRKNEKGCSAIRGLHAALLGAKDDGVTKADDLENLVRFYLGTVEQATTHAVRARLAPLEDALREVGK